MSYATAVDVCVCVCTECRSSPIVASVVQRSHDDSPIRGVALLGNRLYVLHMRPRDQLDELDAHDFQLQRRLSVPVGECRHLSDMASCQRRCRLYVSHNTSNCIHVLSLMTGQPVWSDWKTDGSPWGLSVTSDSGYLLVTMRYDCRVDEFSPDGRLLRRVDLRRCGAFSPWHAVQHTVSLPSQPDLLVLGHGDRDDELVRVGVVSGGAGKHWHGGTPGNSIHLLSRPQHLAVGRDGTLAVADFYNDRVVLFDVGLRPVGVVETTPADQLAGWLTARVCWINRRLCVAEVQSINGKFTVSRLTLYDLR